MSDHLESLENKVPSHILVNVDPSAGPLPHNLKYANDRLVDRHGLFPCKHNNDGMCIECYQEYCPKQMGLKCTLPIPSSCYHGIVVPKPIEWESYPGPIEYSSHFTFVQNLYETNRITLLTKMLILYPKTDRIRKRHIGKKILKVRTHKFNESDNLPKYDDSFLNEVHLIVAVKTRKFKIGDMRDDHCNECGKEKSTLSCCARCKVTQYCDSVCQKKNWKLHKIDCEDDIVVSMNTQLIYPKDKQVADIYDINYCSNEWVILDK